MLAASAFSGRITLCHTASLLSNFLLRLRRQCTALTALAVSAATRACHASHINTSEDVTGQRSLTDPTPPNLNLLLISCHHLTEWKLYDYAKSSPKSRKMRYSTSSTNSSASQKISLKDCEVHSVAQRHLDGHTRAR